MNKTITSNDAAIILESLLNLHSKPGTSPELKNLITRTLAKDVLYVLSENRPANHVSKAALKLWHDGNLTGELGELKKLSVPKQRSKKKDFPMLKNLVLEHSNPLLELVNRIFIGKENIKSILEHDLTTTWVTKEENDELNKNCKSSRPGGWRLCYEKCNIVPL